MSKPAPAAPVYQVEPAEKSFALLRNGRYLMSPAGKPYLLPTAKLAEAVAEEWRAQGGGKPKPAAMPLNQLAATALDIVPGKRGEIVTALARYAETELLCHRAEEPVELMRRQNAAWQPLLDWAATACGARLHIGTGIMPTAQDDKAVAALRRAVEACDDFRLAGLQQAVGVSGSLIIGLAIAAGHIGSSAAFEAAELDSSFQIGKWGDDPASAARREGVKTDLEVCEKWFGLTLGI